MKVLVTGCGGFLGAEIVRQLIARGDSVVGVSRSRYPELNSLGMTHRQGDLTDSKFTSTAIRDCDVVVHTAAVAGVWGPWEKFHSINTVATHNVIDACQRNKIKSLVFTSSPSVTFDGSDQCGIDETAPYPTEWMCHYPHTKALAEQAVLAANVSGEFHTCSLRPHLIWGEDDPHLLARVVDRAKSGRLRIVGDGDNQVDTVHVVNAAHAHICAIESMQETDPPAAGKAFFIAQNEPVNCWDWIGQICEIAGVTPPKKRLSYPAAHKIGAVLEWVYRLTGKTSEPPMTRFVAAQLARHHYFDTTASEQLLGYNPILSMSDGVERLEKAWRRKQSLPV